MTDLSCVVQTETPICGFVMREKPGQFSKKKSSAKSKLKKQLGMFPDLSEMKRCTAKKSAQPKNRCIMPPPDTRRLSFPRVVSDSACSRPSRGAHTGVLQLSTNISIVTSNGRAAIDDPHRNSI